MSKKEDSVFENDIEEEEVLDIDEEDEEEDITEEEDIDDGEDVLDILDNKDEDKNSKPDGKIDEIIPHVKVVDIRFYADDVKKYVFGCDKHSPNLPHI